MIDDKLREAERRWRATGATSDEAAYLLERIRTGEISKRRSRLAARFGYPPALIATSLTDSRSCFPCTACEIIQEGSDDEGEARISLSAIVRLWERQIQLLPHEGEPNQRMRIAVRLIDQQITNVCRLLSDGKHSAAVGHAHQNVRLLLMITCQGDVSINIQPRPRLRELLESIRRSTGTAASDIMNAVRSDTINALLYDFDILEVWKNRDQSIWPYGPEPLGSLEDHLS